MHLSEVPGKARVDAQLDGDGTRTHGGWDALARVSQEQLVEVVEVLLVTRVQLHFHRVTLAWVGVSFRVEKMRDRSNTPNKRLT